VAVNTAHAWTTKHGRVAPGRAAAAAARLAAAPPSAYRILVAHHPLARVPEVGHEPAARGGARLLARAREQGVRLILSGHLHHSFVARSGPEADGPWMLHCGTTTSSRGRGVEAGKGSLYWIEIDGDRATVARRLWAPGGTAFAEVDRIDVPARGASVPTT